MGMDKWRIRLNNEEKIQYITSINKVIFKVNSKMESHSIVCVCVCEHEGDLKNKYFEIA